MKKKRCIYLFVITFSLFFVNCSTSPVRWTVENVSYEIEEGWQTEKQTMNILLPKDNKDVHAIVYIHGGFYFAGNKLWFPLFLTEFSEKNIFATIGYRLISTCSCDDHDRICMEDMLSDIHNALLRLREYAIDNGYSIKDFVLMGHSAGGHLSMLYSYRYLQENDPEGIRIAAVVSLSSPSDFSDDFGWSSMRWYGDTVEARLETLSSMGTELTRQPIELTQYNWASQRSFHEYLPYVTTISPIMHLNRDANIPPTLIVHGLQDQIVPYSNSVKLSTALERYSISHKFITTTGNAGNHMLGGHPSRADSVVPITYKNVTWVDEAKEWLRQFLE